MSRTLLVFGLFFLLTHSASAAGRVFYDGFESGNTNLWEPDGWACVGGGQCPFSPQDIRPLPFVVSTGCQTGSKCASVNWGPDERANVSGYDTFSSMFVDFPVSAETLIRWWEKVDPDFSSDVVGGGPKVMKIGDGNENELYTFYASPGSSPETLMASNGGIGMPTFWSSAEATVVKNTWNKFEWYAKEGDASNGKVKLWVNDVLVWDWTGNTVSAGGSWSPFRIGNNWSGGSPGSRDHDANNHMYVDEVEIFSDTGTGATGSMSAGTITQGGSDTTSPAAPTGLGVE